MSNAILALEDCGGDKNGRAFDVRTRGGAFAGIISERYSTGIVQVYFNSSCTKGSQRKFRSVNEAAEFMVARRIKKGYAV